jgi:glycosyltransferase involved in cell wall biosynthesis
MTTLSVIIPCYKEAATIAEVVARVQSVVLPAGWKKEIIVVDDGSGGETVEILRGLEGTVRVIYRERNGGKGAAVKDGLRVAKGDYCIMQDADLELDPAQYQDLLAPILEGRAEAVFGYRILDTNLQHKNSTLFFGSKMVSLFYDLMFLKNFKDVPCAYKLFPRGAIPALLACPSNDFVFDAIEMTWTLNAAYSVAQVPVQYRPRTYAEGKKIHWQQGVYCLLAVLFIWLGIHTIPIGREAPRVFRFLTTGLLSVAINLTTFYLLTHMGVWYVYASAAGFGAGLIFNFFLNKFWTFKSPSLHHIPRQLPLHFGVGLCNLVLNSAIVYSLVEYLLVPSLLAQIMAAVVISAESFFLQSRYIFKEQEKAL